jgi:hypothetical protein
MEQTIPFHPINYFGDKAAMCQLLTVKTIRVQKAETYLADMTATKDSSADVREIADAQKHLTLQKREELYEVLAKHKKLYDGSLGCYLGRKFHINLKSGTVPYHCS